MASVLAGLGLSPRAHFSKVPETFWPVEPFFVHLYL